MTLTGSFFNWETQMSTSNSTPNYQVITDNPTGLLFRNKRDRKIVNVDPRVSFYIFYSVDEMTSNYLFAEISV